MYQELIMPINQSRISSGFKSREYKKKFGVDHFGVDLVPTKEGQYVYAQGCGIVTKMGCDYTYGNFVQIMYPDCSNYKGDKEVIVANYFHLKDRGSYNPGRLVTKNSIIGRPGNTGKGSAGVHLHFEFFIWYGGPDTLISGFDTTFFSKSLNSLINPLDFLSLKSSSPDLQTLDASSTFVNKEEVNLWNNLPKL